MRVTKDGKNIIDIDDSHDSVNAAVAKGYKLLDPVPPAEPSKSQNLGETVQDFATGAVHDFPLAGPVKAGLETITGDKSYPENIASQEAEYQAAKQRSPYAAGAGSVFGTVAGNIAMPFSAAGKATSALGKIATGAGTGALGQYLTTGGQEHPESIIPAAGFGAGAGAVQAGLQKFGPQIKEAATGFKDVTLDKFTKTRPVLAAEETVARQEAALPYKQGFEDYKQIKFGENLGKKTEATKDILGTKQRNLEDILGAKQGYNLDTLGAKQRNLEDILGKKTEATKDIINYKTNEGTRGYQEKFDYKKTNTAPPPPPAIKPSKQAEEAVLLHPEVKDAVEKLKASGGNLYENDVNKVISKIDPPTAFKISKHPIKIDSTVGISPEVATEINKVEQIRSSGNPTELFASRKNLNAIYSDKNTSKADQLIIQNYRDKLDDVIGKFAPEYSPAIKKWKYFADIKAPKAKDIQESLKGNSTQLGVLENQMKNAYPYADKDTKRQLDDLETLINTVKGRK